MTGIKCPRCGADLVHHEPDKRWRRYFECEDCCVCWFIFQGYLQQGRTPAELFPDTKKAIKELAHEIVDELEFRKGAGA